jgi:hypothetical protein
MKVVKTISSKCPQNCRMDVYSAFGRIKGRVVYDGFSYFVAYKGSKLKKIGYGTDFYHVCDMLLDELGIVKIRLAY